MQSIEPTASIVERFVAITSLIIGLSHFVRPHDWSKAFRKLSYFGRAGAFINGGLSLVTGSIIIAGHGSWAWPGAVVTALGWLLVLKGSVGLIFPELALKSMERGARDPRGFRMAGL